MNTPSSRQPFSTPVPYASGQIVEVDLSSAQKDASYNIVIGENILSEAGTLINVRLGKRTCMIVTDENVGKIYRIWFEFIRRRAILSIAISPGEKQQGLQWASICSEQDDA